MAQEGQTATNPTTGEKVIFRGGTWAPLGGGSSAPKIFQAPRNPMAAAKDDVTVARGRQGMALDAASERRAQEKADRDRREWDATHLPDGTPKANPNVPRSATEIEIEAKKQSAEKRAGTVRTMIGQVRKRYEEDMKGGGLDRLFGATEYIDGLPDNQRFTAEANAILPLIRPLIAQTAREGDSDKEMQVFMAYIPNNNDADQTIEAKLNMLEVLIGGMVDGKTPSQAAAEVAEQSTKSDGGAITIGGKQYTPVNPTGAPPSPDSPDGGLARDFASGVGDVIEGGGDLLGLVSNPANAIVNSALGTDLTTDMGGYLRDLSGLPESRNPITSAAIKAGTGALIPAGATRAALPLAEGVTRGVLGRLAATPVADTVGGASAGGSGEYARQSGYGPGVQFAASVLGGGAGIGTVSALGSRAARPSGSNALLDAAGRRNVPVLAADVGGPMVKRLTAGAAQTPFGSGSIAAVSEKATERAARVRDAAARSATDPADGYGAGKAAQRGAKSFLKTSDRRAERLYENISVEPTAPAQTGNTITSLEKVTQGLDSNPELSKLWVGNPRLRASLDAIKVPNVRQTTNAVGYPVMEKQAADGSWVKMTQAEINAGRPKEGGVSWADMKRLRSIVGEIVSSPSHSSDGAEKSAMRALYAGLSEDMRATAQRAGPKALREFERANSYFRAREARIENVIKPILGDDFSKGGQAAFNQIQNWSKDKGESARVAQLMRSLPEDEADTIGATFISKLGRSTDGNQNAASDAFSLPTFLTHWNALDPRAKSSLFSKGQREALDDLAIIADGAKQTSKYANVSQTAGGLNANATTAGLATSAGLALTGHPLLAAGAASPAAIQYITGRMMASPKFTRALATYAKAKTPEAQTARLAGLLRVVSSEPALAQEAAPFIKAINGVANDNALSSAAASPEGNDKNR